MYRSNIGLNDKYKFGVEIEFSNINLHRLYSVLSKSSIPVCFSLKHKSKSPRFDKWILDVDSSVTKSDGERMVGGELSSRILTDREDCWDEIKKLCLTLKSMNGNVSEKCGLHVNVALDNPEILKTLVKLFFVYENDINLFFMGDRFFVRETKDRCAYSFGDKIFDVIDDPNLLERHRMYNDYFYNLSPLGKKCGLNLDKVLDRGLLEVRYGNGTLEHETIQNFCNFVLKVINAIETGRIDEDFLDYEIRKIKSDPLFKHKLDTFSEDVDKFLSLVRTISLDDMDYMDLRNQYLKVLKTRK